MSRPGRPTDGSDSSRLVEHFFRHESANLVAVLTRAFGVARIDLVEDMVQSAMVEAMQTWSRRGVPDNPAAWIHRVARNRILDTFRREKTLQRALSFAGQSEQATQSLVEAWLTEEQLPDSLLRMMFVCCHPQLQPRSQVALTLKVLCGFGFQEIARGLMMKTEAVKKRIQRAKTFLAEQQTSIELPGAAELQRRLDSVHRVLYLMFNEGYSTSHGVEPIRDDICEEAARLCHLLCHHGEFGTPATQALLALMLFHAARLESRRDDQGNVVLLDDQDRSQWDRRLITLGTGWLARSEVAHPTRYHLEAGIAMLHCRAKSIETTDWPAIVGLYDRLLQLADAPVYRLNRAIARGQAGQVQQGLEELLQLRKQGALQDYVLLECAISRLYEIDGQRGLARQSLASALQLSSVADHERALIERRLDSLSD